MKKIYLIILFLAINFASYSQKSESGIVGGYHKVEDLNGWFVGAFFDYVISEHFDLYTELNYVNLDGLSGLQIPVYLKYYPSGEFPFFLQAGGQWDKFEDGGDKVSLYSVSYGIGVDIGIRWSIQLRGSSLIYSPDGDGEVQALQAALSYRFF